MDEQLDDPLNISKLASSYDNLLAEISAKTNDLAVQLLSHVEEHANLTHIKLDQIQSLISSIKETLLKSHEIDNNIQMLQQLSTFTDDFSERLSLIENLINDKNL
ncbi:hypothetical protein CANINC_004181 [Pichia inconspicua]|uniref:Biogenesis of lysosome-related organelles complex 1 subunit CNL1 n=1 Tax=Pichia inconspicua TaxID=52247 RepID=A0A4T0WWN6_9ASCO|nr:hypothetical protein CANINC_004181 [[Candida] inconspicua]